MKFTDDEISKYLNILSNYKREGGVGETVGAHACKSFEIYMGQYLCIECGRLKGHVLGEFDINDSDRLHYQKKSIYHRKYYFEKKVNIISKIIGLNDEEKSCLYERLLELDCINMDVVNKKFFRKRMININYIIKNILKEMGCEKYKIINLKISPQILEIYDDWWERFKEMIK